VSLRVSGLRGAWCGWRRAPGRRASMPCVPSGGGDAAACRGCRNDRCTEGPGGSARALRQRRSGRVSAGPGRDGTAGRGGGPARPGGRARGAAGLTGARGRGRLRRGGSAGAGPRRRPRPARAAQSDTTAPASSLITHRVGFCWCGLRRHRGSAPFRRPLLMIKFADQVTDTCRYRFVPGGPALLPAKITHSDSKCAALICRVFARRSAEIHRIGHPTQPGGEKVSQDGLAQRRRCLA